MLWTKIILGAIFLVATIVFLMLAFRSRNGTLKRNYTAGYRTQTVLTNNQTWRAGHRAAWVWTGLLGITSAICAAGIIWASSENAIMIWSLTGCVLLLVLCGVGAVTAQKAAQAVLASQQRHTPHSPADPPVNGAHTATPSASDTASIHSAR